MNTKINLSLNNEGKLTFKDLKPGDYFIAQEYPHFKNKVWLKINPIREQYNRYDWEAIMISSEERELPSLASVEPSMIVNLIKEMDIVIKKISN